MKHADTGQLNVVALYGFSPGRNLYVIDSHWLATYIPQNSLRYPFFASAAGALGLAIDESSALIGAAEGQRLFDEIGGPTSYTVQIGEVLGELRQDFEAMREFVNTLTRLQLPRPMDLVLHLESGTESAIEGLYGISERAYAALADEAIVALHRGGYSQALSVLMASLVQINRLQQLHNSQSSHRLVDVKLVLKS